MFVVGELYKSRMTGTVVICTGPGKYEDRFSGEVVQPGSKWSYKKVGYTSDYWCGEAFEPCGPPKTLQDCM